MDELGTLASSHPVDDRRRRVIVTKGAVVGLVSAVLMGVLVLQPFTIGGGRLAGLLLLGSAGGFLVAAIHATAAVRGGPSESYQVHERGLAHTTKRGRRAWTWQEIARIRRVSVPGRFPRYGWDLHCTVSFDDGTTIRFNGLTVDASGLASALLDHRPDALDTGDELPGWRYLRWVLPFVVVGCAWSLVAIMLFLNDDRMMVEVRPGYREEVAKYSDRVGNLLGLAAIVCVLGFVGAFSYLGGGLYGRFRRR
jgi:hypothetical protein